MSRESYHHGNLRDALVEAGLRTLAEDGLDALTLRGCAARVGVSHSAPKNHFPSLEALQAAIVAEGFRRQHAAMSDALASAGTDGRARIVAACEGYARFAEANPDLFRLMFSTAGLVDRHPEVSEAAQGCHALLREVCAAIAEGAGGPGTRSTPPEVMLWSFVHGYASLAVSGQLRRALGTAVPTVSEAMPPFGLRPAG